LPLDVPAGAAVFIDANIFHYAIIPVPPFTDAVLPFVDRLRTREFVGYANLQTLADAQHKTMLSLAAIQYGLTRTGLVGWLKNHPAQVQTLSGLIQAATMLRALPMNILPLDDTALLLEAAAICQTHGLLTNDALIVALMRRQGINHLATNDDDFDRVPGITVWKPRP
jgi:predicted nucleic acid-binding protein